MNVLASLQSGILTLVHVGVFVLCLIACIDSLRFSGEAYRAIGRHSKGLWVGMLAVATGLSFASLPPLGTGMGLGLFDIACIVVAGVYLADIAKKLREIDSKRRS